MPETSISMMRNPKRRPWLLAPEMRETSHRHLFLGHRRRLHLSYLVRSPRLERLMVQPHQRHRQPQTQVLRPRLQYLPPQPQLGAILSRSTRRSGCILLSLRSRTQRRCTLVSPVTSFVSETPRSSKRLSRPITATGSICLFCVTVF